MKNHKAIAKRFKITKNKKVLSRPLNQNHYNAGDSGDETRRKRKVKKLGGMFRKRIISKSWA